MVLLETGVIAHEVFPLLVFVMFGYILLTPLLTPPAIGLAIYRRHSRPRKTTPTRT